MKSLIRNTLRRNALTSVAIAILAIILASPTAVNRAEAAGKGAGVKAPTARAAAANPQSKIDRIRATRSTEPTVNWKAEACRSKHCHRH